MRPGGSPTIIARRVRQSITGNKARHEDRDPRSSAPRERAWSEREAEKSARSHGLWAWPRVAATSLPSRFQGGNLAHRDLLVPAHAETPSCGRRPGTTPSRELGVREKSENCERGHNGRPPSKRGKCGNASQTTKQGTETELRAATRCGSARGARERQKSRPEATDYGPGHESKAARDTALR
jgi:hypothetical protein